MPITGTRSYKKKPKVGFMGLMPLLCYAIARCSPQPAGSVCGAQSNETIEIRAGTATTAIRAKSELVTLSYGASLPLQLACACWLAR